MVLKLGNTLVSTVSKYLAKKGIICDSHLLIFSRQIRHSKRNKTTTTTGEKYEGKEKTGKRSDGQTNHSDALVHLKRGVGKMLKLSLNSFSGARNRRREGGKRVEEKGRSRGRTRGKR